MARATQFSKDMLNGCPGNINRRCRRVIIRGVNHGLVVTATTNGTHAPGSWHRILPPRNFLGAAVDFGHMRPGTKEAREEEAAFQRDLIRTHGAKAFRELFGPDNGWNVRNGVRVPLGEGTPLESQHDNHVHVAPFRLLPRPELTPRQVREMRRRRRLRRNKEIARRRGARFVGIIFDTAHALDMSVPLLLAVVQQETGFENEYGHDHLPGQRPIWHGRQDKVLVTEANYKRYRKWRREHGDRFAQGVGPMQLTSPGYQDLADARGGCWKPEVNIRVGAEILKGHIEALGLRPGIGAYNGGRGNPNLTYADSVRALRDNWQRLLK